MTRVSIVAALVALSLVGVAAPATVSHAEGKRDDPDLSVRPPLEHSTKAPTNTVIVTFDRDQAQPEQAARAAVGKAADGVSGAEVTAVEPITPDTVAVTLDQTLNAAQQAELGARVGDVSGVAAAEPSVVFKPAKTNDTYYKLLWNLKSGSARGVDAEGAWPTGTGKGAVVGVVDTGITPHKDLTGSSTKIVGGNVVAGYDFISSASAAGDGNGRDSNPIDEGDWCAGEDSSWHGTQVAGVIAAIRDNKQGVVGVSPSAKVQPLRVLGHCGGETADIIAAMRWGAGLSVSGITKKNATPVDVLNLSLAGETECTPAMQTAINDVVAAGVTVVAAAGNDGEPMERFSPANCDKVISVTASTYQGKLASYSNYGTAERPATIAAPGGSGEGDALTDFIATVGNKGITRRSGATYFLVAGTSVAAPHVSATAAMLKALDPRLSPGAVAAWLTASANALPSPCTKTRCGAGIVNTSKTVRFKAWDILTKASLAVTGTAQVGKKLTAKVSRGSSTAKVTYQWLRSGKTIKGATKSTYTAVAADRGKTLSVRAKIAFGSMSQTRTASAGVTKYGVFTNTKPPYISGTVKVGKTVKAKVGSWSPKPSKYSYRWFRDGVAISKATKSKYKLKKSDRGKMLTVRVTAKRSGYTSAALISKAKLVA